MKPTIETIANGKIKITCDLDLPSSQRILKLFSDHNYAVEEIDSGRRTPVVEYNGAFYSGSREIMMGFFPGK